MLISKIIAVITENIMNLFQVDLDKHDITYDSLMKRHLHPITSLLNRQGECLRHSTALRRP